VSAGGTLLAYLIRRFCASPVRGPLAARDSFTVLYFAPRVVGRIDRSLACLFAPELSPFELDRRAQTLV